MSLDVAICGAFLPRPWPRPGALFGNSQKNLSRITLTLRRRMWGRMALKLCFTRTRVTAASLACLFPRSGRQRIEFIDFRGIGDIAAPDYQGRERRRANPHLGSKLPAEQ